MRSGALRARRAVPRRRRVRSALAMRGPGRRSVRGDRTVAARRDRRGVRPERGVRARSGLRERPMRGRAERGPGVRRWPLRERCLLPARSLRRPRGGAIGIVVRALRAGQLRPRLRLCVVHPDRRRRRRSMSARGRTRRAMSDRRLRARPAVLTGGGGWPLRADLLRSGVDLDVRLGLTRLALGGSARTGRREDSSPLRGRSRSNAPCHARSSSRRPGRRRLTPVPRATPNGPARLRGSGRPRARRRRTGRAGSPTRRAPRPTRLLAS